MPETPVTRKEKYLAKISGESVSIPSPITREEQYLYEIAVNGSGGGEGGTTNYNQLTNKPKINGIALSGDKSTKELKIETVSMEISGEILIFTKG